MQKRRNWLMGLGGGLAAMLAPGVWAAWDSGQYRIQRALYGTAERNVDVTERLRELARRDARFRLKNETFGVDPDEHRVKTLRIYATDRSGRPRMFEYTEGSWVDGSQFSGWENNGGSGGWDGGWSGSNNGNNGDSGSYRILRARYGTSDSNMDVTDRLRELARQDRRFRLRNETFGSDPAPGRPKMLRIYARDRSGQTRTFEYAEGSWIDGSQFSSWGSGNWGQSGDSNEGWNDNGFGGSGSSSPDRRLIILRADYGTGNRRMDVTERLQQRVYNGRLSFKVDNATAGGDPAEKEPKKMWISYSVNGRRASRVANEGDYVTLP